MNSPTHTLIALAVLAKAGNAAEHKKRNWAVFIGSIIPDAFIYIGWVWLTFIKRESQGRIWDEIYFEPPMQFIASIFNSIPIYMALALVGYIYRKALWAKALMFFALAALIHIAFDFPVHNDDAYAHFWPVSDWRFFSPVSYWDPHHNSHIISLVEAAIALFAIFILWKRFPKKWVQALLLILGMLYAALLIFRLTGSGQVIG